jgi:hypothetical protein
MGVQDLRTWRGATQRGNQLCRGSEFKVDMGIWFELDGRQVWWKNRRTISKRCRTLQRRSTFEEETNTSLLIAFLAGASLASISTTKTRESTKVPS